MNKNSREKINKWLKMKIKISILLVAMLMTTMPALAFDSLNTACDTPGCHAYPPVFLNNTVSISSFNATPGQTFPVTITWTGGVTAGTNTVAKWPSSVVDNALFNPTPQISTVGVFASGSLTSTLTAPSAPGTYTLRAYTSDGTGTPNSNHETDYKVITVRVAQPANSSISLTKIPSATQVTSGTSVTYTYVVTNTGGTTLTNVLVTDNILGAIGGPISLNAGANQTFTKAQVLTANTTNIGTATATSPTGTVTFNATATVTVVSVTAPTLTLSLNTTMDGTSTPIVTNITSAVLLDKSGAPVKTATIPDSITAKFSLSGLTPGDYFIEINGLAGDRLPTRIGSTASDINQQVGLRLRNSIIGDLSNPTYRIKVYPSGLNSHPVVNYNTGFNESIYNFVIVPGNTSKIEVRVLNSSEELSNFSTASLNHPFPTVSFQNWILDFPGASTNHGRVYNNTDSNCNGCHGNLDTKVTPYSSITTGNGWCFRCHYGKTGPRNGFVDPRVSIVTAIFNISGFKVNSATGSGIPSWNITLMNSTMQKSLLTGADGSYKFTNLVNGTYNVTEETKSGFTNVSPTTVQVTINGSDAMNINFTNAIVPPPKTFNISGFKLSSKDNSGVPGWSITLSSLAPNSTLFQTVNTTTDGSYKFTNLTNGIYKVTEGTEAGWTPVGLTTLNVSINGSDVKNQNFTNTPPSTAGSVSGFKINAVTGKGIPGWTITLLGTGGIDIKKTVTTGADGSYTFQNLPAGNYLVKEELRNDFKHVTNPVLHIDLSTGQKSVNNNFVNRPKEKGEKPDTE